MKSASLLYLPFSIFGNYVKKDLSDIEFEKASIKIIITRYLLALILAMLLVDYPLVHFRFLFENGAMQHFQGESFLAGNLDVPHTILRCILVYGYALFLSLFFIVKRWYLKALNLGLFVWFFTLNIHSNPTNILLSIRAAAAWFILMHLVKDFLNKNYKNLQYSDRLRIVVLRHENNNVSVWRAMFFSSIIIALELWINISIFYSTGGAV